MGLYVEVKEDKAAWIYREGRRIGRTEAIELPADELPVVLLSGPFYALGVGYNKKETQRFIAGRPDGTWFAVKKVVLRGVVPGAEKLKEFK